ncbi:MAG: hypothetical protein J0M04_10930 [Verrucomicrobia bacterium]|nr:hypothetical protein [Verrucomicrobiota bacterium]
MKIKTIILGCSLAIMCMCCSEGENQSEAGDKRTLLDKWVASQSIHTEGDVEKLCFKNALPRAIFDYTKKPVRLGLFLKEFGFNSSEIRTIYELNFCSIHVIRIHPHMLLVVYCIAGVGTEPDSASLVENADITLVTVLPDRDTGDSKSSDLSTTLGPKLSKAPSDDLRAFYKAVMAAADASDLQYQRVSK